MAIVGSILAVYWKGKPTEAPGSPAKAQAGSGPGAVSTEGRLPLGVPWNILKTQGNCKGSPCFAPFWVGLSTSLDESPDRREQGPRLTYVRGWGLSTILYRACLVCLKGIQCWLRTGRCKVCELAAKPTFDWATLKQQRARLTLVVGIR